MAHHAVRPAYHRLVERLNRFPQGAPPSPTLYRILEVLFGERDADLVARLPIRPFTAERAGRVWNMDRDGARAELERLASRALLLDLERHGETVYVLPPPMAGFFEFSLMRVRSDLDQQLLSELFHQYLNVEEDFMRELLGSGDTRPGRAFVHEPALPDDPELEVLDYERASEIIRGAAHRAVSLCYCRHKAGHLNRACDAPLDICMTFGAAAASLARHGHARPVDVVEGLDLLQQAHERGLVQFGENVRRQVSFICNCCACCCEALTAARRFAVLHPVQTTRFLPEVGAECSGCGRCVDACPVEALSLVSAHHPDHPRRRTARLDVERCLGCGVCVRTCAAGHLHLAERSERTLMPLNGAHRAVLMALERGRLQDLIFDNRLLWSHRAMAALLGAVLRLAPVQRLRALRQIRSRCLEALAARA